MAKIGVVSDSHSSIQLLTDILFELRDCDYIFHLGDHDRDMQLLPSLSAKLYTVKGNCDIMSFAQSELVTELNGTKVLALHGHTLGVKSGTDRLFYRASELIADIVLFGHTHIQAAHEVGGILFLNPGAAKDGRFARIELKGGKPEYKLLSL